jgi:hypothetical protein
MENKQPAKTNLDILREKIAVKEAEIAIKNEEIKAAKQANGM